MRFHSRTGFSLIEVLASILILSVLASLLLPAISAVRTRAAIAESKSNLRQLVQANLNHAIDHGGRLAYARNLRNNKRWCAQKVGGNWDRTKGYLSRYLSYEARIAFCPLLDAILPEDGPSFEPGTGGYGYNAEYLGGTDDSRRPVLPIRVDQIRDPSNTVMFTTTAYARSEGRVQEYPFTEPPSWKGGGTPSPTTHFRADGRAIVGWCDGRVSLEAPNDQPPGQNPHGGDANAENLGWFGPTRFGGHWNPRNIWINGEPRQ